jgi:adenylate kinase family enzyme
MNGASRTIGRRVLVDGMMGSGKSTFARALAARTGLPVIHLDLHYWKPGWVPPTDDEWRERQRTLVAGEAWIIDGNYNETLSLRLERAETVVYLDTPWWLCASRAFARGLRTPGGEMPEGCEDSRNRRLRDEWGGVGRIWRRRRSDPECARSKLLEQGTHTTAYVLRSRREAREFLDAVCR